MHRLVTILHFTDDDRQTDATLYQSTTVSTVG